MARRDHAEAARSEQPQTVSAGGGAPGLRIGLALSISGSDYDSGLSSALAQLIQQFRNGGWRNGDDRQFRDAGQSGDARLGRLMLNLPVATADQEKFTLEAAAQ